MKKNIMTCHLKAGIIKSEKTAIVRQRRVENIFCSNKLPWKRICRITEELLDMVFYLRSIWSQLRSGYRIQKYSSRSSESRTRSREDSAVKCEQTLKASFDIVECKTDCSYNFWISSKSIHQIQTPSTSHKYTLQYFMRYNTVQSGICKHIFRRKLLPPSSIYYLLSLSGAAYFTMLSVGRLESVEFQNDK